MRKILSLILAVCLFLCMLPACGNTDESAATSQADTETAEQSSLDDESEGTNDSIGTVSEDNSQDNILDDVEAEEESQTDTDSQMDSLESESESTETIDYPIANGDVTFTFCYEHMSALNAVGIDDYSENPTWQYVQEKTGVNIEWVPLASGTSGETFSLWIAADSLPDITGVFEYSDGLDAAIEQEIVISFDDYMECIPSYRALLESDESFYADCLTDAGQLACFCVMTNIERRLDGGLMIRQDWLDELGLETPVTIDDMTEVLTAFKSNYNAGIGLYSGLATDSYSLCNAYGIAAFNMFEKYWYVVDGEVRMGMIQPEYKEYLTLLHSWYEEGLIDTELILEMGMYMNGEVDQINNSEIGVWAGWVDSIPAWESNIGGNVEISALADPVLNEGDTLKLGGTSDSVKGDESFYITTACSRPELALSFMDWFYTEEGILAANYGVEGITYTINSDGEPEFTELITNNELGLGAINATQAYAIYSIGTYQYLTRYDTMYSESELNAFNVLGEHKTNEYEYSDSISLTADESSEYSAIMSDINTYMSTATLQFVVGDLSLDEFDSYVANIEAMGIDKAIQIKQDAYDRYME